MTRLTQNERIVRMLRFAGARGLTQLDVDAPALDGGPPIRRLASRVNELRDAGYVITTIDRRNKMAVYLLERGPNVPVPAPRPTCPDDAATGEAAPASPSSPPVVAEQPPANAIHGWDGE